MYLSMEASQKQYLRLSFPTFTARWMHNSFKRMIPFHVLFWTVGCFSKRNKRPVTNKPVSALSLGTQAK